MNTRRTFLSAILALPAAAIAALKGKPKHWYTGGLTLQQMDRVIDATTGSTISIERTTTMEAPNTDAVFYLRLNQGHWEAISEKEYYKPRCAVGTGFWNSSDSLSA